MDPIKIAEAFAIIVLGSWAAIKERGDRKKKKLEKSLTLKFGLADNPRRCTDHESRLRDIEKQGSLLIKDLAVLTTQVGVVKERIDNIGSLFAMTGDPKI